MFAILLLTLVIILFGQSICDDNFILRHDITLQPMYIIIIWIFEPFNIVFCKICVWWVKLNVFFQVFLSPIVPVNVIYEQRVCHNGRNQIQQKQGINHTVLYQKYVVRDALLNQISNLFVNFRCRMSESHYRIVNLLNWVIIFIIHPILVIWNHWLTFQI